IKTHEKCNTQHQAEAVDGERIRNPARHPVEDLSERDAKDDLLHEWKLGIRDQGLGIRITTPERPQYITRTAIDEDQGARHGPVKWIDPPFLIPNLESLIPIHGTLR